MGIEELKCRDVGGRKEGVQGRRRREEKVYEDAEERKGT